VTSFTKIGESLRRANQRLGIIDGVEAQKQLTFTAPWSGGFAAKSFHVSQQEHAWRTILRLFRLRQQGTLCCRRRLVQNIETIDLHVRAGGSATDGMGMESRDKPTSTT